MKKILLHHNNKNYRLPRNDPLKRMQDLFFFNDTNLFKGKIKKTCINREIYYVHRRENTISSRRQLI